MSKGGYLGGGTIIGPDDADWFGNSGIKAGVSPEAGRVKLRTANPLTAEAERRIGNLRVDIAGLERQLAKLEQQRQSLQDQLQGTKSDLAKLLHRHGLPLDPGLPTVNDVLTQAPSHKTTRNQRRKRARETYSNGK